ncbi:MAG: hypothetical protein M3400_00060 [Actinomycetota bacterium]|nr:hypothetical protein [Actinomycetota bacterium]
MSRWTAIGEREAGLRASLRSLVKRTHREVHAVDGVSFDVPAGEIVGFTRWFWRFGLRNYTGASA